MTNSPNRRVHMIGQISEIINERVSCDTKPFRYQIWSVYIGRKIVVVKQHGLAIRMRQFWGREPNKRIDGRYERFWYNTKVNQKVRFLFSTKRLFGKRRLTKCVTSPSNETAWLQMGGKTKIGTIIEKKHEHLINLLRSEKLEKYSPHTSSRWQKNQSVVIGTIDVPASNV